MSEQATEAIVQLQEFAGYCLTRSTAYGKLSAAAGLGSDGKSTFLMFLRNMVGPPASTTRRKERKAP